MSAIKDILADPSPDAPSREARAAPPPLSDLAAETAQAEPAHADDHPSPKGDAVHTSTTTSTRRNASGSVSSVFSGNKMKHLKKEDGIPLWRKDIQYDFLHLVFHDKTQCFTKHSDATKNHTFAEVYIDSMAKSSKCSKILKEKLLQDSDGAIAMAMVCLLVNVGRMNTTLNFFPEMRAQLRTYHSIPALQANQDPHAYKQLQDAPRLKSILKGATEDTPQPSTIEEIKAAKIPRTNPVNLIFVMSQYAPKVSEVHFQPPRDFFDLVMRPTLSSQSRARAFLWLLWWYLESNFSYEDSQRNPFGAGQYMEGEKELGLLPLKVPTLESLTEEQAALENVDTEKEEFFGESKRKERITILASEPSPAMTALKRARKERGLVPAGPNGEHSEDEYSADASWARTSIPPYPYPGRRTAIHHDTASDYTRSPSPAASRGFHAVNLKPAGDMRINNLLNSDEGMSEMSPPYAGSASTVAAAAAAVPKKGPGRGNWRRTRPKPDQATLPVRPQDGQPVTLAPNPNTLNFVNEGALDPSTPRGSYPTLASATTTLPDGTHVPTPSYQAQKRHRGITQHQSAVISHRKQQIGYNLERRMRKVHLRARDEREIEGTLLRAWKRIRAMPVDYDSEEEAIKIDKASRERAEKDEDWRLQHRGKENVDASGVALEDADVWRRPRMLLAGFVRGPTEPSDVGEEAKSMARALGRCDRRLERWKDIRRPAEAAERRGNLQAARLAKPSRTRGRIGKDEARGSNASSGGRPRSSAAPRSTSNRYAEDAGREDDGEMDVDGENEDGGAAELDEEDRELLGEVDADESEDEDEDEEMGYS